MATLSIIIPCYNQAYYLEDSLNSVIKQTYKDWECIIVNDGSSDNTEEIAEEWVKKDERIKYVFQQNGGLSSARNKGVATATGRFILPLDADDVIGEDYAEEAVKVLEKDQEVKVVYCEAEFFGDAVGKWEIPEFNLRGLATQNLIFCSAFFRKEDWSKVGGYSTDLKLGFEDWDFWIGVLKNGGKVYRLPITGFYYRIRNNSMVRQLSVSDKRALQDYISKKHFDFVAAQIGNPIFLYWEFYQYRHRFRDSKYNVPYRLYRKLKRNCKV